MINDPNLRKPEEGCVIRCATEDELCQQPDIVIAVKTTRTMGTRVTAMSSDEEDSHMNLKALQDDIVAGGHRVLKAGDSVAIEQTYGFSVANFYWKIELTPYIETPALKLTWTTASAPLNPS